MEITRKRTVEVTDIKEALKGMQPGDIIRFRNQAWKMLDKTEDGKECMMWKCDGIENHVFNTNGSNVYEGSDIQKYLQEDFRKTVPEEFDLIVDDNGYFLLTVDQIRKYMPEERDRIANDMDGRTTWYWTASPYVGYAYSVRGIYPAGYVNGHGALNSIGVAPACVLNP